MLSVAFFIVGAIVVALAYPPVWNFFQGVSNTYFWDITPLPEKPPAYEYPYDAALYDAPSPAAMVALEEIKTGWSFETVSTFWGQLFPLAIFLSLLLGTAIIYCVIRILQIRRIERAAMASAAHPVASKDVARTQLRWRRIEEQIHSDDAEKWRLAIMEADIMLNDLLDVLGYKGETMAEKMKQVPIDAFNSIDFAWEAHKIRNRIVHEEGAFKLDAREARRVMRMYERVFKEFKYIE